jgi:hypothetical protein
MSSGQVSYRESESTSYRQLIRLEQDRGTDASIAFAFVFALIGVAFFVFVIGIGIAQFAVLVPFVGAAYFTARAVERYARWRGVSVDISLPGDGLVVGEEVDARVHVNGRRRIAQLRLSITADPPLTGDIRHRRIARRWPLATITNPKNERVTLLAPDDLPTVGHYVIVAELDDLRSDQLFIAKFAVPVTTRGGS